MRQLQLDAQPVGVFAYLPDGRLVRDIGGGSEIIAHVSFDRAEIVEKLRGRELIAADAAVDRSELDVAAACHADSRDA